MEQTGSKYLLTIWNFEAPSSADPIKYDAGVHHLAFTATFATLVTQYSRGKFTGILAESWTTNLDLTEWRFKLRKNLTFSDGSEITPEIILNNFKRVAFLMAQKNSHSDLFSNVIGYKDPITPTDQISGLKLTQEQDLLISLSKPVPNLLETLSFGLYGLIHPSNFDSSTAAYIPTKEIITSGRYKIVNWNDDEILYELRTDFLSDIYPQNNFKKVRLVWGNFDINSADIANNYSSKAELNKNFQFFGPPPSGIMYLDCLNYADSGSPFSNIEFRMLFREALYKNLKELGIEISRSFFPLSMAGVSERPEPLDYKIGTQIKKTSRPIFIRFRPTISVVAPLLGKALQNTGKDIGVEINIGDEILSSEIHSVLNLENRNIDIIGIVTGVLVKNPHSDIRFMFNSKEGIRLPDETGYIRRLVSSDKFEPQEVNRMIIEQAIVWPINHPTLGHWVRPSVDMKHINTMLPPTDFSWITSKH